MLPDAVAEALKRIDVMAKTIETPELALDVDFRHLDEPGGRTGQPQNRT